MGVLHAFECRFHGVFDQIVEVKEGLKVPPCPHGCLAKSVRIVFVQAPGFIRPGSKRADKLVREAAEMQGLSDLSLSLSRSGGSVMDRLRAKQRNSNIPEAAQARAADFKQHMGALTHKQNSLSDTGFGHGYDSKEWRTNDKTGQKVHVGRQAPKHQVPMGATGVEVERIKEKRR